MTISPAKLRFTPLTEDMNLLSFCCSEPQLNAFLLEDAGHDHRNLFSITKIVFHENEMVGFFTLIADNIDIEKVSLDIQEKYDYSRLPAIKIARLATDHRYTGMGVGRAMITEIFRIVVDLTYDIGCRVITVDSKSSAVSFYQHYAFVPVQSRSHRETVPMYLDIKQYLNE